MPQDVVDAVPSRVLGTVESSAGSGFMRFLTTEDDEAMESQEVMQGPWLFSCKVGDKLQQSVTRSERTAT